MSKGSSNFVNRELSWLEFNQRVLDEACDAGVPLLERLKFLAIAASNLDEFFMVRIGRLELQVAGRQAARDPSGLTPIQQLAAIRARVARMIGDQHRCLSSELEPALAREGIRRVRMNELSEEQRAYVERFFESEALPVLTPMAVSAAGVFPLLANLAVYVAARLAPEAEGGRDRFALVPLGRSLDRVVTIPVGSGYAYVLLEDVVAAHMDRVFPGVRVLETAALRIARNAAMAVQEAFSDDFVSRMQEVLDGRRQSACILLQVEAGASRTLVSFFQRRLDVAPRNVHSMPSPLGLSVFMAVAGMEGFRHLKYRPWTPQVSPKLDLRRSLFAELAGKSVLLYHPYESFEPVVRLVQEAASDPQVLAIKQILYRTSTDSPIVAALRLAAERGKHVTALLELKARFDEARNIGWARELEKAGVQVIYGVRGLKTHAKLCIVVRRESAGIVRYLHFGTGNYNERTARLYGDISYLTRDEDLGRDAAAFFNAICGYSEPQKYLRIEAAPLGLRERLLELIENETRRSEDRQPAMIKAKMNSLVDPALIKALYRASCAGVDVALNVRGICCLRPGVPGLSERIRVTSIVDRYLEHARVFYFHHGGEKKVFISSADWMPRNLDRRVELMVPVEDPACKRELCAILDIHLRDNAKARAIRADGGYDPPVALPARKAWRSQEVLYHRACEAVRRVVRTRATPLESHRPLRSAGDA